MVPGQPRAASRSSPEVRDRTLERWGDEHPDTLLATHNLGVFLIEPEDDGQARQHLEQAWKQRALILGEDHELTLDSHLCLAQALMFLDEREECILQLEHLLDLAEDAHWHPLRRLDPHITLVGTLINEARTDDALDWLELAEEQLEALPLDPGSRPGILARLRQRLQTDGGAPR